ncbi:MAG: SBBP repeat-containing protein, partial [Candidatus Doudnabacteria bacterium]|nr:SBBP repeat-containing protein [Candidatus Doudnabacteria bacterium]
NVVPADVEIRGNYFYKPTAWRGTSLVIKNLLELKIGKRVLIAGNVFENNWAAAHSGMALNIKTVNQDNTAPWSITEHITVRDNIIRHVAHGITVTEKDAGNGPSGSTNNVYIVNNLFDDVSSARWGSGSYGIFTTILGSVNNLTYSHNTALHDGTTLNLDGSPMQNFKFTDNIAFLNTYGIKASGYGSGNDSINYSFPGGVFQKNVFVGSGSGYPINNFYPTSASAVGFVNYNNGNGGDYRLGASSPYRGAATDGKDVGADISTIATATSCVVSGACGSNTPPPSTSAPTISSFTASPTSITAGQSATLFWSVSGATSLSINQGVGTVAGTTSKSVSPTATTTYTLTATNSSGSVTASATVTVNAVAPTTIVDGYGDTLLATQFNGWFFSQVGDTAAIITYENVADTTKTYTQTASRTISRPDAETWLKSTYGTNFTITQPLGFTVNPSTVVTAPGTYRIKSVKLNTSNTNILLGPSAQGTFSVGSSPVTAVAYGVDFATYLGGNGYDSIRDITTDGSGNIYVVGGTQSTDFPRTIGQTPAGNMDVFVTKLTPAGQVIWSQLLGGPNYDRAYAVEVDGSGNIYITGRAGRSFPLKNAFQTSFNGYYTGDAYGDQNIFLAKLNSGGAVLWTTYVGTGDMARDMAIDSSGNIYLATNYNPGLGQAQFPSGWFTNAYMKTPQGGLDEVIVKVDTNGAGVGWATYLGGSAEENPKMSIRVDNVGNLIILSDTLSTNAPVLNAYQATNRGGRDAYIVKMKSDGTGLLWATYFGGASNELNETHHLGVDSSGNAYIAVMTQSSDAPTTVGAYDRTYNGESTGGYFHAWGDTLVAKFSAAGQLVASTYVGGSGGDGPQGLGVDSQGNVYFSGGSVSTNYPTTAGAAVATNRGGEDTIGVRLSADFTKIDYATFIGTSGNEEGRVIWADGAGAFYVGCEVASSGMQPLVNALQTGFGGGAQDACV